MFRMDQTYQVRMGCDNCGRDELYELPKGREIINYEREDNIPSAHQRLNGKDYHIVVCRHCGLAALKVLWWKDETELVKVEANNG